jgi:phytoene dehydrogenase-like protein
MKPSLSAFMLYLGMKSDMHVESILKGNVWYLPSHDLESMYRKIQRGDIAHEDVYMLFFTSSFKLDPKSKRICFFVNAPYKTKEFWSANKDNFKRQILVKASKVFPGLDRKINECVTATPFSIEKHTGNREGAAFGWMPSIDQTWNRNFLKKIGSLNNIFFVGHWLTQGFGIPSVVDASRRISDAVLNNYAKER